MTSLDRRSFILGSVSCMFVGTVASCGVGEIPIIDTHIHLFDPNRVQGVPYAGPENSPTRTSGALPEIYEKLARPLGIVGAIEIEASPWIEDNLWALQVCDRNDIMVGSIGNLNPGSDDFGKFLDRFGKNPLFRGIRYGNLWGYDLEARSREPAFLNNLKLVADADLVLETANQDIGMLEAVLRVSDAVPDLRVVLDHMPNFVAKNEDVRRYESVLRELGARPQIYSKLSAVIRPVNGEIRTDLAAHKPRLDLLYETFGEDRVVFGSDWPNSDRVAQIHLVVKVAKDYFADKPRSAQEKFFWRNSVLAYKWVPRSPDQPS